MKQKLLKTDLVNQKIEGNQRLKNRVIQALISMQNVILLVAIIMSLINKTNAQSYTLDSCYRAVERNYPLIKQRRIIENMNEQQLKIQENNRLPQIFINGQATYQSEVTKIPINLPNMEVPVLSKDQYKFYGEVQQTLFDGGLIKSQQRITSASKDVELQKNEVEIYKLHDLANQYFFGLLFAKENASIVRATQSELKNKINAIESAIKYGTALQSSLDLLNVELLKSEEQLIELTAQQRIFAENLALLTGLEITESTTLIAAHDNPSASTANISRPELKLFQRQEELLFIQNKGLDTKIMPRLSLFAQGGYGRPALNVLKNDFAWYYIAGARFTWNISSFYSLKKDKHLLSYNRDLIKIQEEVFLTNLKLQTHKQYSELTKTGALIEKDEAIINLRKKVKEVASTQLDQGTITSQEYLTQVQAEELARLNQALHRIQKQMILASLKTLNGN